MRCAIYFVPPSDDPLTVAAAEWLRRDPYSGAAVSRPIDGLTEADHAFLTALPRRYGFHATLKSPFKLAPEASIYELERRLARFTAQLEPIVVETRIALLQNFFAFGLAGREPDLDMLAASVVTEFDCFRSPLTEIDMARRDVSRLSGRQLASLMNWGSPNIFADFRFHMTLTGPIDHLERDHVMAVLERHFGEHGAGPLEIGQLVLAVEPEPHAPFIIHSAHTFGVTSRRKIA